MVSVNSKEFNRIINFWHFIIKLNNWIFDNKKFGYDNVLLIMDNWSSHKSKSTINTLKELDFRVNFLPIYSPDLANVEMCFAFIKQQLCKQCKSRKAILNSKISQNELYESLKRFTNKHVKRWFFKFYKTLKLYLNWYKQ